MDDLIFTIINMPSPFIISSIIVLFGLLFKLICYYFPIWSQQKTIVRIDAISNKLTFFAILGILYAIIIHLQMIDNTSLKTIDEQVYLATVEVIVRSQPEYKSSIIKHIPCGSIIQSSGETSNGRYIEFENGYIEKSQLTKDTSKSKRYCKDNKIPLHNKNLYGTWLFIPTNPKSDIILYTFFNQTYNDNTILYDGLYNGKRLAFKRLGGKYTPKRNATPITWDVAQNGNSISIQLWTEVTKKGYRMKWDLIWNIMINTQFNLLLQQKFVGLDSVHESKLVSCKSIKIQNTVLQDICNHIFKHAMITEPMKQN